MRRMVPAGSRVLFSITEDEVFNDKMIERKIDYIFRQKRSTQGNSTTKCPENMTLVLGSDYDYVKIDRNQDIAVFIKNIEWNFIPPWRNLKYGNIQDDLLRSIHNFQSWTLIVERLKKPYRYSFYQIDAYLLILTADNLISDLERNDVLEVSLSLPIAKLILVILGKIKEIDIIFKYLDKHSMFEAVVLTQDYSSDETNILSWTWNSCGYFKEIVILGSCREIMSSNYSFHITQRPIYFNRCNFKTYGQIDPPFAITDDKDMITDGIGLKVLEIIASHLQFSITPFSPIEQVEDIESRKGLVGFGLYIQYMIDPMTFIKPYYIQRYFWFVPSAESRPRWTSMTRVFKTETWLCVLAILILVSLFQTYLNLKSRDVMKCLLTTWGALFNVSLPTLPTKYDIRMTFLSWVIFSITFTTIFQAYMTSFFIDPGKQHQMETIEELEKSDLNISIAIMDGRIWQLLTNRSAFLIFPRGQMHMLRLALQNSDTAVLISEDALLYSLRQMCQQNRINKFHKLSSYPINVYQLYYISLSCPYLAQINEIIIRLTESGIVDKIVDTFVDPTGKRMDVSMTDTAKMEYVSLTGTHMFFSFIYLLAGFGLSCLIFVIELFAFQIFEDKNKVKKIHK
ncbi:hypothetical protein L9F63_001728 [Diploptera punctata]|uniref:Ionotropic glutamate receptor C-terminal domain-containing protein n=1 Tax=Diploptera punctata TaxID=6984 RepID=A0AAD8EJE5_DIPPU|nr:hypothetical protein L9F63_001728 [Diploptera punctata]